MMKTPVLDRDQLLDVTGGDVEFERELLMTFRASAANILAQLQASLAAGHLTQIARDAHALRGASVNVGAKALGECAGEIEVAARVGDLARARNQLGQLQLAAVALWAELDRM
jgi:HPt (histidine-containing phosphotransfer) domain-containing protein